jgi:Domain of unknown function (DUF4416)
MGEIHEPARVLLIVAASSRYLSALVWAAEKCAGAFGAVALSSGPFEFTETDYYSATMGAGLRKQFFAFERLIDPEALAGTKCRTNEWEAEYAALGSHPEPRPLNLDPGYITSAKLVLASTKDHAHRIYLAEGIYAELTLSYRKRAWLPLEWTYPDYRRGDYQRFFTDCREWLLNCESAGDAVK